MKKPNFDCQSVYRTPLKRARGVLELSRIILDFSGTAISFSSPLQKHLEPKFLDMSRNVQKFLEQFQNRFLFQKALEKRQFRFLVLSRNISRTVLELDTRLLTGTFQKGPEIDSRVFQKTQGQSLRYFLESYRTIVLVLELVK